MRQRRLLYRCIAGVEANNLRQSDPGSEQWLCRNPPSRSGRARVLPRQTTPIIVSDFMSSDGTEMSFIPLRSWCRGQQPPAIRSRIGAVVVEESTKSSGSARVLAIKTTPIMVSDFMGSDATETSFIPLRSWRRAPQPPAIRSRIGAVVVEESVIEFWDCQDSIQPCNFMNRNRGGMNLTSL